MINLLPPEIRTSREVRSHVYSVAVIYIVIVAALILGSVALETYNFTLKSALGENEATLNTLKSERQEKKALISKLAFIEDRVANSAKLQDKTDWLLILDEIAQATPSSVHLASITLSSETDKFTLALSGDTSDSRAIILFRDRLDESKSFTASAITSITTTGTGEAKKFVFNLTTTAEVTK